MSVERPEGIRHDVYELGRDHRLRLHDLEPGRECTLRFRDQAAPESERIFEYRAQVLENNVGDASCGEIVFEVHCRTFDREVPLNFDSEGFIFQRCGCEEQEIGYVVGAPETAEDIHTVPSAETVSV